MKCPKCGNDTLYVGYGYAGGGGLGGYYYCDTEGCDYFDKTPDPECNTEEELKKLQGDSES